MANQALKTTFDIFNDFFSLNPGPSTRKDFQSLLSGVKPEYDISSTLSDKILVAAFIFHRELLDDRDLYGDDFLRQLMHVLFYYDLRRLLVTVHNYPLKRILLFGETGAGKEKLAKVIGQVLYCLSLTDAKTIGRYAESITSKEPPEENPLNELKGKIKDINAATLSETLFHSEMFGHVKGSFTDAFKDRPGILKVLDDNGTLFLDEVGDTPSTCQAMLLRAIQYGEFSPLGSDNLTIKKNFHLVSATNVKLEHKEWDKAAEKQKFRQDLYYRIASPELRVPSLRERIASYDGTSNREKFIKRLIEDILFPRAQMEMNIDPQKEYFNDLQFAIVNHFTETKYDWPGNLREATKFIQQVICQGPDYCKIHRAEHPGPVCGGSFNPGSCSPARSVAGMVSEKMLSDDAGGDLSLLNHKKLVEKKRYEEAARCCRTLTEIGYKLGVCRQTAKKRLKEYGLIEEFTSRRKIPKRRRKVK